MAPRSKPQLYFGRSIGSWIFIGGGVAALLILYVWPF